MMEKNTQFKDIPGFEEKYQINEEGEIYSNIVKRKLHTCLRDKNGYLCIGLLDKFKKQKILFLHRLIALTFIPNPNNYKYINHKDGNKINNNLNNLEWCSMEHNIRHAYTMGLNVSKRAEKHHGSILTWKKVKEIRKMYPNTLLSQEKIAKMYGVSRGAIEMLLHNVSWYDKNYSYNGKNTNK